MKEKIFFYLHEIRKQWFVPTAMLLASLLCAVLLPNTIFYHTETSVLETSAVNQSNHIFKPSIENSSQEPDLSPLSILDSNIYIPTTAIPPITFPVESTLIPSTTINVVAPIVAPTTQTLPSTTLPITEINIEDEQNGWQTLVRVRDEKCRDIGDVVPSSVVEQLVYSEIRESSGWQLKFENILLTNLNEIRLVPVLPSEEFRCSGTNNIVAAPNFIEETYAVDPNNFIAVSNDFSFLRNGFELTGWLPERNACEYAKLWIDIKLKYNLTMDENEYLFLVSFTEKC